jgi:hypothetical protein
MTSSASIDDAGFLAGEMRRYPVVTQLLNKLVAVVSFIAAQGYAMLLRNFFHHCHRRLRLCATLRQSHAAIDRDMLRLSISTWPA